MTAFFILTAVRISDYNFVLFTLCTTFVIEFVTAQDIAQIILFILILFDWVGLMLLTKAIHFILLLRFAYFGLFDFNFLSRFRGVTVDGVLIGE
jgi:hypothetical protein